MKVNIHIRSLGVRITPETPEAEISALCAKFPVVKTLIDKANGNKEKDSSTSKGATK